MTIDPHIFRAYDIRGKALTALTEQAAELIGKAFGTALVEIYSKPNPTVVVGRDARLHGPQLEEAVVKGLTSTGCQVMLIGETPSPVNYFTICTQKFDGGVQVTASHNPAEDNGLKLQIRGAEAYAGAKIQALKERIETGDFKKGEGTVSTLDAINPYVEHLTNMFAGLGEGLSIAVDSGNGVAGPTYTEALKGIDCNLHELYSEPDGRFPNHPADPSKVDTLKELQELVVSSGSDLGFGYDGDGDRVGLVDETGTIWTADEILLLLAQDHLSRNPGKPVVFTVSNSGTLNSEIEAWGGKPVMCKVGHSFVEHTMTEHGALLGGEQSGHFFCGEDYFGFDDALMTSLRIIKIVKEKGQPLSKLKEGFPQVYQAPEKRPHCPDDKKSAVIAAVTEHFKADYPVETMDGARIDFGDGAWVGIRQSNTSPCLSICLEARSPEKLEEIENLVMNHLNNYPEVDA